jgi:diguanylate cyclase (GGDEF)-like protein
MLKQGLRWMTILVCAWLGMSAATAATTSTDIGALAQILLWRDAPEQLSLAAFEQARTNGNLAETGQTQSLAAPANAKRAVWAIRITGGQSIDNDDLLLELIATRHRSVSVSQLPDYQAARFQLRSTKYRGILARFSLPITLHQQAQSQWLFVDIVDPSPSKITANLRLGSAFLPQEFVMTRVHAIVATAMWVSVLAAFLFFITLREPIWLWYCATVALSALFLWMREGEWPGAFNDIAPTLQLRNLHFVAGCCSAAMTAAFMMRFMDDSARQSRLARWTDWTGIALCAIALSRLVLPYWTGSILLANLLVIFLAILLSINGVRRAWAGQKNAQILMLAYSCGLFGVIMQALLALGIGQREVYMDLFFLVGFGIASMVLFLGLARSVLQVRVERDVAKLQASTDGLTGAFNHQAAQTEIVRQLTTTTADNPLSVCFVDLDLFKRVNDQYGHLVGDETLRQVVNVIRPALRQTDLLARWGGEEFIILLPKTTAQAARTIAESIRASVQNQCAMIGTHPVAATVSIGIATSMLSLEPADLVLDRADQALYRAKHAGRNRVVLADY